MLIFYAVIIVLVLIIISIIACNNNKPYEKYLHGFWLADESFCENSEIDSLLLFVGEPTDDSNFWNTDRLAYIIIAPDMSNQGLTLSYKPGWAPIGVDKYIISANVKFDEEQIWPECVDICVDIRNGTMKIYKDDTIYAKLIKNLEITSLIGI